MRRSEDSVQQKFDFNKISTPKYSFQLNDQMTSIVKKKNKKFLQKIVYKNKKEDGIKVDTPST